MLQEFNMKNVLVAGAVALALSVPASALAQSPSDLDALKAQVEELNRKISEMETKQSKSSWTEKVAIKADLRYRFEYIDLENAADERERHRIRGRIGIVGKPNDNTEVGFGIRTGGNDPRSGNATLDGDSASKDIALDLGYATWMPTDAFAVTAGKMKQPWAKNGLDYLWDGDYNPEGLAAQYDFAGDFFVNAHWFQIDERSSDDDTYVFGGQVGYAGDLFYANAMYQDYQKMEGYNPCYQGDCNGNTVDADGNLVYDYNILSVRGGVKLAGFDIFGTWQQNDDADDEDSAYSVGFKYGKAKDPGTWEVGAVYHDVEKDSVYGGVVDADPGNGDTDFDGWVFKGAYALGKNWNLGLTYLMSNVDTTGNERDYDRVQLDFSWKL
jgi:hypothetical protein